MKDFLFFAVIMALLGSFMFYYGKKTDKLVTDYDSVCNIEGDCWLVNKGEVVE